MFKIVEYKSKHQPWFEKLNRHWIEKYFEIEPLDRLMLADPETFVLKPGGNIFMVYSENTVIGTVAIKRVTAGVYELSKMAVDEEFQGRRIGYMLANAALDWARQQGATSVVLYTNTTLLPAMSLYRKLGFKEVPLDGSYKRSNIKMELLLSQNEIKNHK